MAASSLGAVRPSPEHPARSSATAPSGASAQAPMHSHDLPFFGFLSQWLLGDAMAASINNFHNHPMSLMFRPAGIPHQMKSRRAFCGFSTSSCVPLESAAFECSESSIGMEDARAARPVLAGDALISSNLAVDLADPLCVEPLAEAYRRLAARLPLQERNTLRCGFARS